MPTALPQRVRGPHGGYGLRWQRPDPRDLRMAAPAPRALAALPPSVDLRPSMPPVYDQGDLGSCTANAAGAAFQYEMGRQGQPGFVPSRLAIYYGERDLEGSVGEDAGAEIRDAVKVLNRQGAAPESLWPYDVARFAEAPPQAYLDAAAQHQVLQYLAVAQSPYQMKYALFTGLPLIVGFTVYASFESDAVARSGVVPMPAADEAVLGGHAVLVVGYDDAATWSDGRTGAWIVRNSWGERWGRAGYFLMPSDFLLNASLASDFWAIKLVEG